MTDSHGLAWLEQDHRLGTAAHRGSRLHQGPGLGVDIVEDALHVRRVRGELRNVGGSTRDRSGVLGCGEFEIGQPQLHVEAVDGHGEYKSPLLGGPVRNGS